MKSNSINPEQNLSSQRGNNREKNKTQKKAQTVKEERDSLMKTRRTMDEKEKIAIIGEGQNTFVIRPADKISIQNPKSCKFNSLEVIAGQY